MAKDDESLKKEAEGIGVALLGILGLPDLVIGGLAMYSTWAGKETQAKLVQLFPPTGFEFLDAALLACSAALVGKVITFIASFLMAVLRVHSHAKRAPELRTLLSACGAEPPKDTDVDADLYDFASLFVANSATPISDQIENAYRAATFTSAATIVSVLYICRIWELSWIAAIAVPGGLLALAYFLVRDHEQTIVGGLRALRRQKGN